MSCSTPTDPETDAEKLRRAEDADILINSRGIVKWPAEILHQLPELKLISLCSIGTDMIGLEAAKKRGITVCNQPGRTAPVVAEHGFGLMFALAQTRSIPHSLNESWRLAPEWIISTCKAKR